MPLPRAKADPGRHHRLPPGTVEAMLRRQGGRCLICGRAIGPGKLPFVVEHDHLLAARDGHDPAHGCPRCVRSLACGRCNSLLGAAGDDPELLRRAAAYVEAAREKHR
jgi:hypothetical protein